MKNMIHPICNYFIQLFSDAYSLIEIEEDFEVVKYKWDFTKDERSLPQLCSCPQIASRDSLYMTLLFEGNLVTSFNPASEKSTWENMISAYDSYDAGTNLRIELTVYKKFENNHISIYQMDSFINYLEKCALSDFLSIFSKKMRPYIIFELQSREVLFFYSQSIFFLSQNVDISQVKILDSVKKEKILKLSKDLCCQDCPRYELTPEDFYFFNCNNNKIKQLFDKVLAFLCFLSIFDYIKLEKSLFSFRLNGFKILKNDFNTETISNFIIDTKNNNELYEIYRWIYTDGNATDKLNISRNILSLNLDQKHLKLDQNVFEAIKSNYRIYQKENVEKYLSVRKEISELLITLQGEINSIVSSFIDDFKKNIITVLSLFISVIVVNVISNSNYIKGFNNNIILLIFSFLLISLIYLFFSRWELDQKTKLYEKHFNQIKQRYSHVLSEVELQGIFDDCNPDKDGTHASFIIQQRNFYSVLWFLSLLILFIITLEIYNYNNGFGSYILNLFKYRFCNSC
ncbi:hypothetical protein DYE50_04940 [Treponema ruminis]|uniref:Uncharacterized protein n=1 Tax=Treponema ruminis TaxID=744515 RepID=A0A7W8G7C4_9SPIR|nr:hypothetical protein [Treponema ruminis]MBB5225208.1 hypothetical protein [Treponema ruminis]QSI01921.1 hypothetical protein DYE50_04940 [Treponema ruminis]